MTKFPFVDPALVAALQERRPSRVHHPHETMAEIMFDNGWQACIEWLAAQAEYQQEERTIR